MDQVLLTFGFTFVFFDLVQTLWGRLVLRLPAPEILAGHGAYRGRRVLGVPAVPDRLRIWHRAPALAVSRTQPPRRHGPRRRRQCRHGRGSRRQHSGAVHRHFRRRRGARGARRRRCRARARPLPGHGYRNPHPGVHRDRDRRDGKPARRVRRQPADRHRRYLRQGLFPVARAVSHLSDDGLRAADPAAGPVRHQIQRRLGRAGGHRRQRAGDDADPRRGPDRARRDAGVSVPHFGLPACAGHRDLHFRDLRHEPRSAARLHRADVARARRILRARRLRRRGAGNDVRRQRLDRACSPA